MITNLFLKTWEKVAILYARELDSLLQLSYMFPYE